MWRRGIAHEVVICALAISTWACHRSQASMPDLFPAVVGAFHRTAMGEIPPAQAPDPVPRQGLEAIRTASYDGPGKLEARVYQMNSPAVALEVVQRWTPAPDTVFFYADRFFVVVRWDSAERGALHEFVGALEKRLNAKQ